MKPILARVIKRFGTQLRVNGVLCLGSNGDPALVAAFAALGWPDPCPVDQEIEEAATVVAPERAVLPAPVRRVG